MWTTAKISFALGDGNMKDLLARNAFVKALNNLLGEDDTRKRTGHIVMGTFHCMKMVLLQLSVPLG